jgi:hypothetical protein
MYSRKHLASISTSHIGVQSGIVKRNSSGVCMIRIFEINRPVGRKQECGERTRKSGQLRLFSPTSELALDGGDLCANDLGIVILLGLGNEAVCGLKRQVSIAPLMVECSYAAVIGRSTC